MSILVEELREEKIKELKNRADKIFGKSNIITFIDEQESTKLIDRIINTNDINIEEDEKALNKLELYILIKEKIQENNENNKILEELAEDLRNQRIRKDDVLNIPLFKVITNEREYYFITRKEAHKFIENNKDIVKGSEVIQIEENEDKKLEKLINTIKENF